MSFGLSRGRSLSTDGFGFSHDDLPSVIEPTFDPRSWFEHPDRRFELEIGSGKGTFLVQQSDLKPETNFLGIEWAAEFYRYAADRIRRRQLNNVRMLHDDAVEFIRYWCVSDCADVIHLYFSDPWPKKRHHKRRVVQNESLAAFHRILKPGGELRIVTDHDDLWEWMTEHAGRHEHLFERESFEPPESASEGEVVGTNFERKYRREGRPFHGMTLRHRQADS